MRRQLREANRYRNKLVEIEHERRKKIAEAQGTHSADLADVTAAVEKAQAEIEVLYEAARKQNQMARKKTDVSAHKAAIRAIKTERLKPLREQQKRIKVAIRDDARLKELYDEVNSWQAAANKAAYNEAGEANLSWGTRVSISGMFQSESKKTQAPKFHGFRGEGRLAVQLQGGLAVETALACSDTQVRVDQSSGNIHLRIGSVDGKKPLWCVVRLCAPVGVASRHWASRPLPDDAMLKWVYLTVRRCGPHEQWKVHFVMSRASGFLDPNAADGGIVAVNLGWRMTDSGLRVATWVGDDGKEGAEYISERDAGRWAKADSLQAIRDRNFNATHAEFMAWLTQARLGTSLPEWFRESTATAGMWRGPGKLAALCIRWRDERFEGDEKVFTNAEAWRKQDKHLWTWQVNQKRKAIAWRMNLYRCVAARLRKDYATVVLPDVKWAKLAKTPESTEDSEFVPVKYRAVAAPALLQRCLTEKSRFVQFVDPHHITQTCHACQKIDVLKGSEIAHTCRHCAATWDQDANAARNALRLAASADVTCEPQ